MGSEPTTLTPADVRRFERDGYVVVRQAFSRADGLAMERRWWSELEDTHGIRPDDRSSWRQLPGDLKAAKRDPMQAKILTGRVRGVLDDLLGPGAWPTPRDWGRPLVTFPEPGAWDVPARHWHWDNPCELHLDRPRGAVRRRLHRLGRAARRRNADPVRIAPPADPAGTPDPRGPAARSGRARDRFHRSHPWLMALTGQAPSPADRIAAFMDAETTVDGVPLRVVELTGEPGDMIFCHPLMVHCAAPNRGTRPRFMRIKTQILTHEGRDLRDRLERLRSAPTSARP